MKRYSKFTIILHWLLVPAIFMALFMGTDISQLSDDLDLKVDRLAVHMTAGLVIGGAFIIRFFIKYKSASIEKLNTSKAINTLSTFTHNALYLLVFSVVISGITVAAQVDLPSLINSGGILPDNFSDMPARYVHAVLTKVLMAFIGLHILAALFHHFIKRDKIFSRIWFTK